MEAIIFDLGGVILDIDIAKTNDAFRRLGLKEIDDYFGLGHAAGFFKDYENGIISDEDFVEKVRELLNHEVDQDQVKQAWNELLGEFPPERIQFLKSLKDRYRLFLFSNTNGIHQQQFARMYHESFGGLLDELFEKAYYSHTEGFRKPDAKGFLYILEQNNLEPGETYFVDDAWVNVEAANKLGIKGLHVKPGQTILDLPFD